MREAIVKRAHIGEDNVQVSEGDRISVSDERFEALRRLDPPLVEAADAAAEKAAPAPQNKAAQKPVNKSN